jgi:transmembrane protein 70, mitochondrial
MFTSFLIGKQAFFLDPKLFPDTDHYIKIMGYDKPIDFKLQLSEEQTSATEAEKKK